jgi:hypothetical protein
MNTLLLRLLSSALLAITLAGCAGGPGPASDFDFGGVTTYAWKEPASFGRGATDGEQGELADFERRVQRMLERRGFALQAADGVWLGGAHALFVLAGVQLGYLGWWPAICALAAPLPLWLLRGVAAERPWRWLLVSAPAPLALMGLAMWLAAPEPNPYGY